MNEIMADYNRSRIAGMHGLSACRISHRMNVLGSAQFVIPRLVPSGYEGTDMESCFFLAFINSKISRNLPRVRSGNGSK